MQDADNKTKDITEGIVVPPGCDCALLHESGERVRTFTPSSYRPVTTTLPAHNMRGKTCSVCVPKNSTITEKKYMSDYLRQFQGAYLCVDLWYPARAKMKICGILLDIGESFLVFQDKTGTKINLVDLKPVQYLTIYCK